MVKDSTKYFNFPSVRAAGEEKIMWTLRQSELNSNPSSHLGFLLYGMTLLATVPQKCTAQSKCQSLLGFRSQIPPTSCVISRSTSLGLIFSICKIQVIVVLISLSNSWVEFIVFVQNYFSKELPFKWINEQNNARLINKMAPTAIRLIKTNILAWSLTSASPCPSKLIPTWSPPDPHRPSTASFQFPICSNTLGLTTGHYTCCALYWNTLPPSPPGLVQPLVLPTQIWQDSPSLRLP